MCADRGAEVAAQKSLLDAVAEPAFFVDRDYRYLAFNEADRRVVRDLYGTDLVVGASLLETVTIPEDREAMRSNLDRALAGETCRDAGWFGRESARRFYSVTYAPVLRDGMVAGVAATATDATDLFEARSDLQTVSAHLTRERELARTLLENLVDGVVACDVEGTTILMNRAAREASGIDEDAVLPAEWGIGAIVFQADGVTPLDPDDRPIVRALRGERPHDQLFAIRRKGAALRTMLASGDAFFSEAGEKLGAVVVFRDATERQSMIEELRRSQRKFEAIFRVSPDAISISRRSDGRFEDVNEGFTALTGFTREDVEGKTSLNLPFWDDPADRERLLERLRVDGFVDKLEARFRRKDGSIAIAEMSARIMDLGADCCILAVTSDISERKRAEAAQQASYEHLERVSSDMVQTLGRVVEAKDPYTQGHEVRVAELCRLIAERMGLHERDTASLETAALVHDIGKLRVPSEILTKPGTLSTVEFRLIKEHPESGYEILQGIAFDWPIAELVLQHHERMDGTGYPRGLSGDEIQLPARILTVADVVEAMATHRPYRPALGLDAAIAELRDHLEKYDPGVVAAFITLCDEGAVAL